MIAFLSYVIILQVLIPISLYVSLEFVKMCQIYFITQDRDLYYEESDQPMVCRALNISEDLGQVEMVFSDKTGTLTENQMIFRWLFAVVVRYHPSAMYEVLSYFSIAIEGCSRGSLPFTHVYIITDVARSAELTILTVRTT